MARKLITVPLSGLKSFFVSCAGCTTRSETAFGQPESRSGPHVCPACGVQLYAGDGGGLIDEFCRAIQRLAVLGKRAEIEFVVEEAA